MQRTRTRWIAILPAVLLAAGPAAADWLRTREGALVETKGPWTVRESLVIFTAPNGTLSSLRLSEIDLDASAVATMEAKNPPPPPAEEPEAATEAVFEITMKSVRRAAPPAAAEGPEGAAEEAPGAASPPPVKVIAWRVTEGSDGGIQILGTVRNDGREIVTDLGVTVSLLDDQGQPVSTANAFLGAVSLAPGVTTTLRALFPDLYQFAGEPAFEVRANPIRIRSVAKAAADEGSTQETGGES